MLENTGGEKVCGLVPQRMFTIDLITEARAMVTMMTLMMGSPIMGLNTSRSRITPMITPTIMVSTSAKRMGMPVPYSQRQT